MGDNGKILDTINPQEVLKTMVKFMNNTNEILSELALKQANQQVDIDKIKKHLLNKPRLIIN